MIDVLLLAGGKSSRMGEDKATMLIDGQPLLARIVDAVNHLGKVHIVGGSADLIGLLGSRGNSISHIPDPRAEVGPFGAMVHAAQIVDRSEIVVISCDLAQLTSEAMDLLVQARRSTGAAVAVPLIGGRRQWHALVFAAAITPLLASRHDAGITSFHRGFAGVRECAIVPTTPVPFGDIDTPEDLAQLGLSASSRPAG